MNKWKRAFSLIEVLIVVAILALLASLVLPVVKGNKDKANYEVSKRNLWEVAKAMEKHYLEVGQYPIFKAWGEVAAETSPLLEYLNEVPAGDAWSRPYNIVSSTENSYEFQGYSIPGKLKKNHPDYFLINGPKFRKSK